MTLSRPSFHLSRVYSNGAEEFVGVVPITRIPPSTRMGRRGFLTWGSWFGAGAASASVGGCGPKAPTGQLVSGRCGVDARANNDAINSVSWSPDSQTLASGSDDRTIKLWKIPDGALKNTLTSNGSVLGVVAFSPKGNLIASGSGDADGGVRMWSYPEGVFQSSAPGDQAHVQAVTFSPDGSVLAWACGEAPTFVIQLLSVSEGATPTTLSGHTDKISSIAFSPDGRLLASASDDRTLKLWSIPKGALQKSLDTKNTPRTGLAFSHDALFLACGTPDGDVELWSVREGVVKATLVGGRAPGLFGETESVHSIAISPDGKMLAAGTENGKTKVWNLTSHAILATLTDEDDHSGVINTVAFSPDGHFLASGSQGGRIKLWATPKIHFVSCLIDSNAAENAPSPAATGSAGGVTSRTGAQACGVPIPPGAICTCNCIAGR